MTSVVEFLTNYSYRTMVIGTAIIGACAAALGCFLYLRKQSLMSDVIGHSSVAGVMGAFALTTALTPFDGRSMLVLTIGAVVAGLAAVLLADHITRVSPISPDTAMAICLALFYGIGLVGLHLIVKSSLKNRGGIANYMFGNAASITSSDIRIAGGFAVLIAIVVTLLWKELTLFVFDPVAAEVAGFSSRILTPVLLCCSTVAIVIGIKAVGMILMVAFAIMPAAAARQWTKRLSSMVLLATLLGAASAVTGSYLAVCMGKVPTGAVIVLVLFAVFLVSLFQAIWRSKLQLRRSGAVAS